MQVERIVLSVALTTGLILGLSMASVGRRVRAEQPMPVSYVCPMDADVLADQPSMCPTCKMDLQPVRIESAWSCPTHAAIVKSEAGQCELDGRDLVPVVINHFWVCPDRDKVLYPAPGRCADRRPREERKVVRAHGDHNPRHGGQFFMASDQWHHVEGTHPSANAFRLHFYDNFTKPLEPKGITGRVFTYDEAGRELAPLELRRSRDGMTLEVDTAGRALPLRVTAKLRFRPEAPEQRFDFVFSDLTKEFVSTQERANPTPSPTASAPSAPEEASQTDWTLPNNTADLVMLMDLRTREVRTLIDEGNLTQVYLPAMLTKQLALAMADHVDEFGAERRSALMLDIKRIVLAAWHLDRAGDLGNRDELVRGYEELDRAVTDVKGAYATR